MKRGLPERDELVVCRVIKLFPNSATVQLLEYNRPGMMHVSEVASRWVRDIREFLKENQYVVCRVVRVEGETISVSMKRVRHEDTSKAMNEFKRERKAENILEQIAKTMKKSLEQAYQEVGFLLQEEFGSLTKAFDLAVKNPDLLKTKGVPPAWAKAITEVVQKRFGGKTYVLKGDLELRCYQPDGIAVIKSLLAGVEKRGFQVSYISAPTYRLVATGNDVKKLRAAIEEEAASLVKAIEKAGGEGAFTLQE
ncbi:MAG: hypothetical protein HY369_05340 [Candidatus Aenigmarchaeota archaeon]|nr:hypothetical protein [Candidatus Aenigmarchaeota archaeon]